MWWHKSRNQISSFGETEESISIGGGRQFSRLLAGEVCASAIVMLHTPCSEVVWRVLVIQSIRQFPLHFPSRVSPCTITFQLDSSNAGYTMFRGSVKSTGYPLHSPVSPLTSPPVRHRVPSRFNWTLQEAGCDPGWVWTDVIKRNLFPPTRVRASNRPLYSKSLQMHWVQTSHTEAHTFSAGFLSHSRQFFW